MNQTNERVIERARDAIGSNSPDNYDLGSLSEHIDALGAGAGPLRRVLSTQTITQEFDNYERSDADGRKWQGAFKRRYQFAFLLLMLTLVASIFVLIWPMPHEWTAWLQPTAMIILTVSLLASLTVAWHLTRVGHYEKWHESRGKAEFLRRKHFVNVIETPTTQEADELPPLLLKLFYFRRYQLELQTAYHKERGGQHERRALIARLLLYPSLAAAFVWLVLVMLAWLAAYLDQGPLPIALPDIVIKVLSLAEHVETITLDSTGLILVFVVSLIYGVMMIVTRLDGNLRNAARYAVVRENLAYLLDEPFRRACAAAHEGDKERVLHFVWEVHAIMANENADWVRLRELDRGREILSVPDISATT